MSISLSDILLMRCSIIQHGLVSSALPSLALFGPSGLTKPLVNTRACLCKLRQEHFRHSMLTFDNLVNSLKVKSFNGYNIDINC